MLKLDCGLYVIHHTVDGRPTDNKIADISFREMAIDSKQDRLYKNYINMSLKDMRYYSLVVDGDMNPVMFTGAQHLTNNVCRLFSRYYLFTEYRTDQKYLYNKVDNFESDMMHLNLLRDQYKLFIWSRDRGNRFFQRIKQHRPDVFGDWTVHPDKINLMWPNNDQGLIYTGDSSFISEIAC